jgi:hypothetical protein|tara:strand:+ start:116 stop:352 length:237 start_codon:yes stop_codon:yes gene_type:complete
MESAQIVDIWNAFKADIDKKNLESVAESYIDTCADYGADDQTFRDAMGTDEHLDHAINYYLDVTEEDDEDSILDDWDE